MIRLPRYPGSVAARPAAAAPAGIRAGFSLVELLVVMSIMVILMGLVAAAVAGARSSQAKQSTRLLISKLDAIIQQQMATYAARVVPPPPDSNNDGVPDLPSGLTRAAYRSWYIRRNLITGDLPDRWSDVAAIHDNTDYFGAPPSGVVLFPKATLTASQKTYISIWHALSPEKRTIPGTSQTDHVNHSYSGAECLFMIVMQGGVADCVDCGELRTADRGDKDGDGLFEFWDSWGNPIGFILWPAALQLPAGSGTAFFTTGTRALETISSARPAPALGMRPLIYSAGPDGEDGFNRAEEAPTITAGSSPIGRDCGNPFAIPTQTMAAPEGSRTSDNITNLDAEALK